MIKTTLQDSITSALTAQGAAEQGIIERVISALIEFIRGIFATFCSPLSMLFNSLTGGAPETPPPPTPEPEPTGITTNGIIGLIIAIAAIAILAYLYYRRELKKDEENTEPDIAEPSEAGDQEEEEDAAVLGNFSTVTPTLNVPKIPENEDETEPDQGNAAEPEEEQEEIEEPDAAVLGNFSTVTPTLNVPKIPENEDATEPDQGNAAEPEEEQEEIEEIEEIEGEEEEGGAAGEKMDRSFTDSKSEDWAEGLKKALEAYAASGAIENMSFAEWIRQGGERRNE